ncbi:ATP-dependent RNA helicase SUV3 homolog, mitochondrial [Dermacentor silvarum]|uniref:ATP-dependent RNA helicase SUV3 homolog, mitochondrial n=1 Tax=Dermacentor silvarum TaxID=543639 RepID=UPI00189B58DE|nr:ATP-dependent RNA helicase SUV3 homolog, mitochondrial [Dermacentor silvarum]
MRLLKLPLQSSACACRCMSRTASGTSRHIHLRAAATETVCGSLWSLSRRFQYIRLLRDARQKSTKGSVSSLFMPVPVKVSNNPDDINVGEELTTKLKKEDLLKLLNQFSKRPEVIKWSEENGLDARLFHQAFVSFRRYCMESEQLPADLHIIFSDLLQGGRHLDDLVPYFLQHARQIFPHLECMEELQKISDLRHPGNWYPEARAIQRKVIFHAGPTNSGKTHAALAGFHNASTGLYCGPLKMLAVEVFQKTNEKGTPCDLVTGEERRCVLPDGQPALHVACTVEMAAVHNPYDVAVIDEIQMMRDPQRGWAWTRALLGLAAKELHLCGEAAAIGLVRNLLASLGEDLEVRKYKRLTQLTIENRALESLEKIQPGDCVVCFNKSDIYQVSLQIERQGLECAVIYGGLPPGTKLAQAQKFNDPDHPCKVLVATDAIGMGLNLSIGRVIFYSLVKPAINERGERQMDTISTSQALQIAGRAGRFGSRYEVGRATTMKPQDLPALKQILAAPVEQIEAAGLHPTAEQIELFAYHLPHATLANLVDIFVSLCKVDSSSYFMCNLEGFKFLADMIQHVPLPLRARYVFCCSPINQKMPFVCSMFLKFARQYSRNEQLTYQWLGRNIGWPLAIPKSIMDLVHLEAVFDVLDLYLWLSYRFPDLFPDAEAVRAMQQELDLIIQKGVLNITQLLRAGMESASEETDHDEGPASAHAPKLQGKLADRLLAQGLLTKEQLLELQREWQRGSPRDRRNKKPK